MTRSTKATAAAVAAGALVLGVSIGAVSIASADPTPTPTAAPTETPSAAPDGQRHGRGGRDGFGFGRGGDRARGQELVKTLAEKLGVSETKVSEALQAHRDENRPRSTPGERPDQVTREAALAKSLASKLGVDEAKVKAALAELRSAADADRAAALQVKLDAAVKAGTLTQAEADAVAKAAKAGVIRVSPR